MNILTVFFDYNCPFCYISFKIIEELKYTFDLKCIYKPCELYPSISPGGIYKEELMLGYDVDNIYKKLRILGDRNDINFGKLDKKYNSHMSLLLSEYAQDNNKITEFSKEIFKQYYINDKDISNLDFLKEVCYKIDLDYDRALEEINNGALENKLSQNHILKESIGLDLFPTYIINGEDILSGILTKRTFLKAFESLK